MEDNQNGQYSRVGAQYGYPQYPQYQSSQGHVITQAELPEEFRPLSMWAYFGYSLLYGLPIIGFICVLVFSFGGTQNINHRNFSRSYLCAMIIGIVITIIIMAILITSGIFTNFSHYYSYYNY